jgi:hypothetical protein
VGYYKQQEVDKQHDVDRIVAWYYNNGGKFTNDYLWWLLDDDARLWRAIEDWERQGVRPKPASSHVSLWSNRDHIRRERAEMRKLRRKDFWLIVSVLAFAAVFTAALIWIAGRFV